MRREEMLQIIKDTFNKEVEPAEDIPYMTTLMADIILTEVEKHMLPPTYSKPTGTYFDFTTFEKVNEWEPKDEKQEIQLTLWDKVKSSDQI